jgi:hypothetical protein
MWALKRQLAATSIVAFIVFAFSAYGLYTYFSRTSCFDNTKNGNEEGVDCGGVCARQCLNEIPKEPALLWSRVFQVREGFYDVGALVENTNLRAGTKTAKYRFRIYDGAGVLLDTRDGETWLFPNQKTFVFESNLKSGLQKASRVDFDLSVGSWDVLVEEDSLKIEVVQKRFETNESGAEVFATLINKSVFEEPDIEVTVLLAGPGENVYAASRTEIKNLAAQSRLDITFTWPLPTIKKPDTISLLYRRIPK